MKTPTDFYNAYNGKAIDYDGAYGVQCVDGFKVFCHWAGIPVKPTLNNWANGYWIYRDTQGFSEWFDYIYDASQLKDGDWCIWDKGSSNSLSHIAMYYKGQYFGERQGGNNEFRLIPLKNDIMGALRWKGWTNTMALKKGLNYISFEGADLAVYRAPEGYDLFMLSAGEGQLKTIDKYDNDNLLVVAAVNANYFQMNTEAYDPYGTHYGVEQTYDGTDLAPKSSGLTTYFRLHGNEPAFINSSKYYFTQSEVDWACSPYSILRHDYTTVNIRSSALGDKDNVTTFQTMVMQANGFWCLVISRVPTFPAVMLKYAESMNAKEAILMDGGGSTQMMAYKDGKYDKIQYTGRELPNVFCIAKVKDETNQNGGELDPIIEPDEPKEEEPDMHEGFDFMELFNMSNKTYDRLKFLALIGIPAFVTFINTVGKIWEWQKIDAITQTISAFAVFLGAVLIASSSAYAKREKQE